MLKTRDAVLCYQETQSSDKSTKTIDLDLVDPISAIVFEFEARNGTTNNIVNPFPFVVTKMEIVDGSDVLASLSFPQAQALKFYKDGKQPELRETEDGGTLYGGPQVMGTSILFGRKLWDRDFALDLTKFANPQLKISWDLTNIRACSSTTAFYTGTMVISAWAKVMEGQPAPGKFLMAKEIEAWTGATSGDKRHELPVDFPYHLLMLRLYSRGYDVDECITKLKLTCDTDKFIPFERYTKQLDAEMAQLFGNAFIWKVFSLKHDDTIWFEINKEPQVYPVTQALGRIVDSPWHWAGNANIGLCDHAGAAITTREALHIGIEGHALHHTLPLPMGVMDEPDTWFDPTGYKKLELIGTEAVASANALVAEQVRPN
jgi:hypothetical protein